MKVASKIRGDLANTLTVEEWETTRSQAITNLQKTMLLKAWLRGVKEGDTVDVVIRVFRFEPRPTTTC